VIARFGNPSARGFIVWALATDTRVKVNTIQRPTHADSQKHPSSYSLPLSYYEIICDTTLLLSRWGKGMFHNEENSFEQEFVREEIYRWRKF